MPSVQKHSLSSSGENCLLQTCVKALVRWLFLPYACPPLYFFSPRGNALQTHTASQVSFWDDLNKLLSETFSEMSLACCNSWLKTLVSLYSEGNSTSQIKSSSHITKERGKKKRKGNKGIGVYGCICVYFLFFSPLAVTKPGKKFSPSWISFPTQ